MKKHNWSPTMTDKDSGLEYIRCYDCKKVYFIEGENDYFNFACNELSPHEEMKEQVRKRLQS